MSSADNFILKFSLNRSRTQDSKPNYGTFSLPQCAETGTATDNFQYRKIPNQNIVARLIRRETCFVKQNVSAQYAVRCFHQNIVPNLPIVNIEKPPCSIVRFSPDGRYFVAFSGDLTSVEIYDYRGPSAGDSLISKIAGTLASVDDEVEMIRRNIFYEFFHLRHSVNVGGYRERLDKYCSLFTDDCNHIIVASCSDVSAEPSFFDIKKNNESLTPNANFILENYTLYIINMTNGNVKDKLEFKIDKILLFNNQGLYLYHDILCVLSLQHQTIHVYQVTEEGYFINIRNIGRFCCDDDEFYISNVKYPEWETSRDRFHPFYEPTFSSLKQKVLKYFYNYFVGKSCKNCSPLLEFYKEFDFYAQLKMYRLQMLDKEHLLIKYTSEEVITLASPDINFCTQHAYFVVYNMVTTEICALYDNSSKTFLLASIYFSDNFRNAALHSPGQLSCSPSNNSYARSLQFRHLQKLMDAGSFTIRFNGEVRKYKITDHKAAAIQRTLFQLPVSSQSYSTSPYLDLSLFSYEEWWALIGRLNRHPKDRADRHQPIMFYARDSGLFKFKIFSGIFGRTALPNDEQFVSFMFHPSDPFVVSVQRASSDDIVNLHIRFSACEDNDGKLEGMPVTEEN